MILKYCWKDQYDNLEKPISDETPKLEVEKNDESYVEKLKQRNKIIYVLEKEDLDPTCLIIVTRNSSIIQKT